MLFDTYILYVHDLLNSSEVLVYLKCCSAEMMTSVLVKIEDQRPPAESGQARTLHYIRTDYERS